jgi:hypothetical protein
MIDAHRVDGTSAHTERQGRGGTMKKDAYNVYYRSNASGHYIYLAKQSVEIVGNETRIELNGQLTKCVVEDVEWVASDSHELAGCNLYLRRKGCAVVRSADVLAAQQSSQRGILRDLYLHE